MALNKIYAQLSCTDIGRSEPWFREIFGRAPDAEPMKGLVEWHHGRDAGFQLFENQTGAGHGCLTLIVSELEKEHKRLVDAGVDAGAIQRGDIAAVFQVTDPDGNVIVFAEPST